MKKSFPVHIGGRIYYFDEDAYDRLNTYYYNLRQTFTGEEGGEIVDDIENRVSDLIADSHPGDGYAVVTVSEVDSIITRMGQPEQLAEGPASVDEPSETNNSAPPPFNGLDAPAGQPVAQRRLYRDVNDKVIAGVISGLAKYWSVNVTALRVIVVILGLCATLWPLIILYVIGWLLIPAATTPRQILEMEGRPVTVDTIGQTTISGNTSSDSFWKAALRVCGFLLMGFVGFIGVIIGIVMIIVLLMAIAGLISYIGWHNLMLVPDPGYPVFSLIAKTLFALVWLIPGAAAIWAACCVLFKAPGISRRAAISVAIIEVVLIITLIAMTTIVDVKPFFELY